MKKYTLQEKSEILKEVESIGNIALVCRKRDISYNTVQNWVRRKVTGSRKEKKSIRSLQKKIFELNTQNLILKDLLKKTKLFLLGLLDFLWPVDYCY